MLGCNDDNNDTLASSGSGLFFFFFFQLTMKMNSYIRPYSEERHSETDVTTVVKCHSGSDDCLVQHVLMATKRKGKSVEWVVNCTTLLSVYISCNRWLPSSCLSYSTCSQSLVYKTKCLL